MFDLIGTHTQYDDNFSILDPQIIQRAADFKPERFEGVIWNRLASPDQPIRQESFKIGARTRTGLSGTIGTGTGTGWADAVTTTNLPMNVDAINALIIGSVMEIYNASTAAFEVVNVKDVDRSALTIDVIARGAGGTAAIWADDSKFKITGSTINDLDLKNQESRAEKTYKYENYVSLITETITTTYTDLNEARKYFENMGATSFNEALDRIFQKLSSTVINGVKVEGSNSVPPQSAGIRDQLQDTMSGTRAVLRSNANGTLTQTKLNTALDLVFLKGNAKVIYLSYANKKIIDSFTVNTQISYNADANSPRIANQRESFDFYEYQGVLFELVVDKAMPDSNIFIVNENKIRKAFKEGDPLRFVPEPTRSSRESRWSFQGKVAFIVEDVGHDHVDLYGITP